MTGPRTIGFLLLCVAAPAACTSFGSNESRVAVVDAGSLDAGVPDAVGAPSEDGASAPVRSWRYVFVTSEKRDGQLGPGGGDGRSKADMWCRERAEAGDARLHEKKWVAWLSTNTEAARTRLDLAEGMTKHEYRRVDDEIVFAAGTDFEKTVTPARAIDLDEGGTRVGDEKAWTGATNAGDRTATVCKDWSFSGTNGSGTLGSTRRTDAWSEATTSPCNELHHVYCFEID